MRARDLIRDRIPVDTRYERTHPTPLVPETTVGALMTSPATAMSTGIAFIGLLLGSTSQALVNHAGCPGLVVRPELAR